MSSPVTLSSAEAIVAAAHELKLRRLAAAAAEKAERPAKNKVKEGTKAKTVRCRVRMTKSEYRGIAKLQKQLARRGVDAGKGELVRASLLLLLHLDAGDLKAAIRDVIASEATPSGK